MSFTTIKVGVAQTASQQFDFAATLAEFTTRCEEAKALGVELLVFPEAFFGGYPKFSNFGASVGTREPDGRREFAAYYHGAIAVPSPETDAIAEVVRRLDLAVLTGFIEKEGTTLFCSLLYVDPVKGVVGKHRKVMPTAVERLIWGNGDGSPANLSAHSLQLPAKGDERREVKVGGGICWENMMPLLRYNYYQQGIQLYVAPTVDGRTTWLNSMVHIAIESRCFVLSANQFAVRKDFPPAHQKIMQATLQAEEGAEWTDETEIIAGGSCIISPLGEVLAGPMRGKAGVLAADIDLDEIIGGRFDLDSSGHYSRSDIFELLVKGH
ncbi:hypothetical protein Poli38472_011225 [Pythium oligandrum]|uniref:CN hydrolase domain-containing protein n=1 Tax=Pythium oligandrum TaxID=41045 RepID=A0A8K1FKX6_PYTOL|nr:hypothetical protein Poli38472_011225 [Pythium oligandrum]|eukprot:TMW67605.1 hypothetical protein Poli38472_011225 [Pythium oligandrum]